MKFGTTGTVALLTVALAATGCANTPSQTQREEVVVEHQELPGEDYERVAQIEVEKEVDKDSVEVEVERDEAVNRPGTDYTSSQRLRVEAEDGDIDTNQTFDVNKRERGPDEELTLTVVKVVDRAPRMVHFPFNKASLDRRDKKVLRTKAQWLKKHPNAQVVIEGHTDERGSAQYNEKLARERAKRVEKYLDKIGVDTGRIEIVAVGEKEPLVNADSERAYLINRRAEIERASN